MFRGYIPSVGKNPIRQYKNQELLNTPPKSGDYVGVLNEDIVQLDCDDPEQSEAFLQIVQTMKLKTNVLKTSRGLHFYFKNTRVKTRKQGETTAIGFIVDVGLGSRNTAVPLVLNGEKRHWVQSTKELDFLPDWLLPVGKLDIKWFEMDEGDGRNQELFNYILILQKAGLSKKAARETIDIINRFILKTPLSQREIDTITRDEAFPDRFFYKDNVFQHNLFGDFLINNESILNIYGKVHVYSEGIYQSDETLIKQKMIQKIPSLKDSQRNEVLKYIQLKAPFIQNSTNWKCIGLKTAVLDLETMELGEYSENLQLQHKIPVDLNPIAYDELTDTTLNKICCHDAELRMLIEEMIGYCLLRRNEIGKSFLLTGDGSNGKSTLLDMIANLVGHENISNLSLKDLLDRFRPAQLIGKLVNLGDDISNEFIFDTSDFKKFVTGSPVTIEKKGQDPFNYTNYAKFIFSANELPKTADRSSGFQRRMIIIPFNAVFSKSDPDHDPFIRDKLTSENALQYLLLIGLQGLSRVLENQGFTEVESVKEQQKKYEMDNNPILYFIEEAEIENQLVTDVYKRYVVWCHENGYKVLANNSFSKEIKRITKLNVKIEKINGKSVRIYR